MQQIRTHSRWRPYGISHQAKRHNHKEGINDKVALNSKCKPFKVEKWEYLCRGAKSP